MQLFRDCSESLLRDLVLQLRPVSCLPGDVVVRRGEVGHEMYIVKCGECYVSKRSHAIPTTPHYAIPCHTTAHQATPQHATPYHVMPRRTTPHHATPFQTTILRDLMLQLHTYRLPALPMMFFVVVELARRLEQSLTILC